MRPTPHTEVRRRLLRLGRTLNITFDLSRHRATYTGNGRVAGGKRLAVSSMAHEMGHWLVAHAQFRPLPNYGLGGGNEDNEHQSEAALAAYTRRRDRGRGRQKGDPGQDEEELASILGIVLLAAAGGDYEYELDEHSWLERGLRELRIAFLGFDFHKRKKVRA